MPVLHCYYQATTTNNHKQGSNMIDIDKMVEDMRDIASGAYERGTNAGRKDGLRDALQIAHDMRMQAVTHGNLGTADILSAVCNAIGDALDKARD